MNRQQLSQARWIEKEIAVKSERIERLRALAEKCTAHYGERGARGSGAPDRRAEIVARIVDMQDSLRDEVSALLDRQYDAADAISLLPDPRMRVLMEARYVSGASWRAIAELMGCDLRQVYRTHDRALKILFGKCQ